MAKKVADYIQQNKDCFRTFSKVGLVPMSVVSQFNIYVYYCGLTNPSKMQKYQDTADALRINIQTVQKAVKEMQRSI